MVRATLQKETELVLKNTMKSMKVSYNLRVLLTLTLENPRREYIEKMNY